LLILHQQSGIFLGFTIFFLFLSSLLFPDLIDDTLDFVFFTCSRSGAAYCELWAGKIYKLEVTDKQYLPKSGVYADLGVYTEVIPEAPAPQ